MHHSPKFVLPYHHTQKSAEAAASALCYYSSFGASFLCNFLFCSKLFLPNSFSNHQRPSMPDRGFMLPVGQIFDYAAAVP